MTDLRIGYARGATAGQDLTAQRHALAGLGVDPRRVYVDHGMTGTNPTGPGSARPSQPAEAATRWW